MNDLAPVRKAVLVIGMHRSGTSAMTRGLKVLGVDLGTRLKSPRIENPKGFWEDIEFNSINTDILRSFGLEWHSLGRIDDEALRSTRLAPMLDRAMSFLDKKFQTSPTIGLKDPKASRILPFWQYAFERAGISASYVIACRNPMSVEQSLSARDGFPSIQGYFLWLDYMLCSLEHSCSPRILVAYENLLDNPGRELTRISSALSLNLDMQSEDFMEYNSRFLTRSLQSTNFTVQNLYTCNNVPSIIKNFYSLLNDLSIDSKYFSDKFVHNEIYRLNKLFNKDIFYYSESIEKIQKLEKLEKQFCKIENQNLALQKKIENIYESRRIILFSFKLNEKFLHYLDNNNIVNALSKIKRHFRNIVLILGNVKSWSFLQSLPHEFGEILKNTIRARQSEQEKILIRGRCRRRV